jgi:hypothetical protein
MRGKQLEHVTCIGGNRKSYENVVRKFEGPRLCGIKRVDGRIILK